MGCCRGTGRSQRNGFQLLASEAFTLNRKHDGIIKDAVKGTQQRVVFTEVLLPLSRVTVAGKNHVVTTLFLVSAVNHIEKESSILLVKLTVPHLINNQAGRTDKRGQQSAFTPCSAGICHAVTQLSHFNEIRFQPMLTAGTAKSLRQVRFACSGFANEGKVFVGVYRRERRETPQFFNISASNSAEIKIVKSLRGLERKAAGTQQELHRLTFLFVMQILKSL